MADKCQTHRKDIIGNCMWCGKGSCKMCVVKQQGNKVYCEKCVKLLGI